MLSQPDEQNMHTSNFLFNVFHIKDTHAQAAPNQALHVTSTSGLVWSESELAHEYDFDVENIE